eukprot:Rhum_TRINITY_DN3410_c0_g1::Rhum_TRINITY_DN3410_c0_g1_i1::g.10736::m.10736
MMTWRLLLAAVCATAVTGQRKAEVDMARAFSELEPYPGDNKVEKLGDYSFPSDDGWFHLDAFSFGMSPEENVVEFESSLGLTTPSLMRALAEDRPISLEVRQLHFDEQDGRIEVGAKLRFYGFIRRAKLKQKRVSYMLTFSSVDTVSLDVRGASHTNPSTQPPVVVSSWGAILE